MSEGIFLIMFSIICFLVAAFIRGRERMKALEKLNKKEFLNLTEIGNEPRQ